MKEVVKKYLDRLAKCYKEIEQELRYDGNRVNNFASLVFCRSDKEIDYNKIKSIRKYISKETPWFSSFRGDALNMISILLHNDENWEKSFDRIKLWEEALRDDGFTESAYLAMSSWILFKCTSSEDDVQRIKKRIKEVYSFMSSNYSNITAGEDYFACVFISLTDINKEEYENILNYILVDAKEKEYTSSNGAQSLANVFVTDVENFENNINGAEYLVTKSKEIDFAIPSQYIAIAGLAAMYVEDKDKFIDEVKKACDYLTKFDEYAFFMDKSFRFILAMIVVMYSYNVNEILLYPTIGMCITSELEGQAQSLICKTL